MEPLHGTYRVREGRRAKTVMSLVAFVGADRGDCIAVMVMYYSINGSNNKSFTVLPVHHTTCYYTAHNVYTSC